jgi:LEA14-like dessication related protein
MKRLAVLASLAVLSLSGCAALRDFFAKAFQQPSFNFKTVRIADASFSSATLHLVYSIDNPNSVGLSLAEVQYALFIEGKQVVAGRPPNGLSIPARGSSELVFPANIKFADIAPVVQTFLTKDRAKYRAQGQIGLQTPIGVLRFPLARDGEFEVPKLPAVQVGSPRVAGLSLSGARLELPLTVRNRNSFPLPIGGLSGGLTIGGANVGNVSTGNLGLLQPGTQRQLNLPVNISFAGAAAAAFQVIQRGNGQVGFNGQVQSGGTGLPLGFNQTVNFIR